MNSTTLKIIDVFNDCRLHIESDPISQTTQFSNRDLNSNLSAMLDLTMIKHEENLYSTNERISKSASTEFVLIGVQSVAILTTALKCDINHVAINAANSIRSIGKCAKSAVFNLAWMLHHKNKECREIAAATLGVLKTVPSVSVFVLAKALNDNEQSVRQYASAALGEFDGGDLRSIANELESAVLGADKDVRVFSQYALSKIGQ